MQLAPSPTPPARLLRVAPSQRWVAALPQQLKHVLLLADQHPETQRAIDFAIELAEHYDARLTLMHGGDLQPDPAFWTSDSQDAPDPNQTRLALLGLLWDIRKRCPEVGLCTAGARLPEHVLQAATQHGADLLVVPASLFGRFLPLVGRSGQAEVVDGASCPVLVVERRPTPYLAGP